MFSANMVLLLLEQRNQIKKIILAHTKKSIARKISGGETQSSIVVKKNWTIWIWTINDKDFMSQE